MKRTLINPTQEDLALEDAVTCIARPPADVPVVSFCLGGVNGRGAQVVTLGPGDTIDLPAVYARDRKRLGYLAGTRDRKPFLVPLDEDEGNGAGEAG